MGKHLSVIIAFALALLVSMSAMASTSNTTKTTAPPVTQIVASKGTVVGNFLSYEEPEVAGPGNNPGSVPSLVSRRSIDPFGNTELSTFDERGNRTSTTWGTNNRPEGTYTMPTPEHPEGMTLDAQGQVIKFAYPIYGTNQYADSMGRPITDLTGYTIPGQSR